MSEVSSNNSRIAKNTLLLYFRMFITMVVGLFTSRVILDSLGIEDYGIYNLVGGFVIMFNVFRAGLISSTQRFITFDLGTGNMSELRNTFSTSLIIFLFISCVIIVIAEGFAPWFIQNKLTIPASRLTASMWVFQFSLLTLIFNLISSPYNALIIAHEKMGAFAYISIFEVMAKLAVAYLIYISPFDKLIVYAFLLCLVQIIIRFIYTFYCNRHFEESKVIWRLDWKKIKKIYAFTGWELFGSIAVIGYTQGLNILLGMFFNPVINAARGVALQVQSMILGFVTNFQTALNPQITKSYASGDIAYMHKLIFYSSKLSFFLLFVLSLPIMLEAEEILSLWLVEVPEYTVLFFRLIIITTMIDAISNPIIISVEATGNIRKYQVVVGSLLLLILPISYVALKLGAAPYSVFIVHIIMSGVAFVARLIMGSHAVGFNKNDFLNRVLIPILGVILVSSILPFSLHHVMSLGLIRLSIVLAISILSVIGSVYYIGLQKQERELVLKFAIKFISKLKR